MFSQAFWFVASVLLTLVYWINYRTWFIRHVRRPTALDSDVPRVLAHWHGDELLLIGAFSKSRITVMTSRSKDGEHVTRMLKWLGYNVVRGSSSRGGAGGLKGLTDAVSKGARHAAVAVDGPRGPIYRIKPGVIKLAQCTKSVIIPGAASAKHKIIFKKAWNRCYLPLPWSRCVIVYGEPMVVPGSMTDGEFEELRKRLEIELTRLKNEADAYFEHGNIKDTAVSNNST